MLVTTLANQRDSVNAIYVYSTALNAACVYKMLV